MMPRVVPATILSGTALSSSIPIGDGLLKSILMPAAWSAAILTFQGSLDGVNYYDIYDNAGAEVSFTVLASQLVVVSDFGGALWIKIRSGSGGGPVNQGADRALSALIVVNPMGASLH